MALIFPTDISTVNLLYAFNNNVVIFKSNTTGVSQIKSEILTNGNTYTIYPNPNGDFWFNFKEIKSVELANYDDTINPDMATSLTYDWSSKALLEETVTFKIYLSNSTIETATRSVKWLNGYVNLIDFKRNYPDYILDSGMFLLKPLPLVKYWEGLPFDIAFYKNTTAAFTLKNNSNLIDWTFTAAYKAPRLFFSDGRLDFSIEDYVSLNEGFNSMTLSSTGSDSYSFQVEKITKHCKGHYLKWLNSFGGWSYWLFYQGNENINTKELGITDNDFNNLPDTVSPTKSLGFESNNSIQLQQEGITPNEMLLLRDLLDSVKVYLFTGIPFTQSGNKDWIEVIVSNGNFRLTNAREKNNSLALTIELPKNTTRKL